MSAGCRSPVVAGAVVLWRVVVAVVSLFLSLSLLCFAGTRATSLSPSLSLCLSRRRTNRALSLLQDSGHRGLRPPQDDLVVGAR